MKSLLRRIIWGRPLPPGVVTIDSLLAEDRVKRERTDAILKDLSKRIADDEYALHMIAERCGSDAEEMRRWAAAALAGHVEYILTSDAKR